MKEARQSIADAERGLHPSREIAACLFSLPAVYG